MKISEPSNCLLSFVPITTGIFLGRRIVPFTYSQGFAVGLATEVVHAILKKNLSSVMDKSLIYALSCIAVFATAYFSTIVYPLLAIHPLRLRSLSLILPSIMFITHCAIQFGLETIIAIKLFMLVLQLSKHHQNPIHYAISIKDPTERELALKLVLNTGADLNALNDLHETPLYRATDAGHLEIVQLLLKNGADVNALNSFRDVPLHIAADAGHLEIVQLLLKNGADVNASNNFGNTSLHIAADAGHLEIVQLLLKNGADVNASNSFGSTPLHKAADAGHLEIVQLLLKNDADVNAPDRFDSTPLHIAAQARHLYIFKLLLKSGADVTIQNKIKYTPFHLALQRFSSTNKEEMILAILLNNPNMNMPEQLYGLNASIWTACELEIENLNQYTFTAGKSYRNVSLSNILQETREERLALFSRNPEILEKVNALKPECPISCRILQEQLEKGKRRIEALDSLSKIFSRPISMSKKRHTGSIQLPTEMCEEILNYLPTNDLIEYNEKLTRAQEFWFFRVLKRITLVGMNFKKSLLERNHIRA